MIRLSEEHADDVLERAGIAALYYDEADVAVNPGAPGRDVDFVLEPLALTAMTDEDRARLREVCARVIVDPTRHRREFVRLVLSAIGPATE
ncbi:hypothetical protein BOH66_02515 [Microbacterium aurum]|uniref:Uncharacterized protein n=1 Tax=Microbacterium aurum TaxID=36805 RepID=A0A1P8U598_9MICO|nr:hypothetical protein [Microbacterium aurum]APZ33284.1 hypothetical protein BOH66_02515 [Microbacterium aurum]MBM7826901.1 hypothetical protein [Microbacterium aurum]